MQCKSLGLRVAAGLERAQREGMNSVGSGSDVARWVLWSECWWSGGEKVVLTLKKKK